MRGYRLWAVVIIAVAIISVWMSIGNHHISFLGMNKDIKVVQGLDLQGGSRVLLQVAPGTQPTVPRWIRHKRTLNDVLTAWASQTLSSSGRAATGSSSNCRA